MKKLFSLLAMAALLLISNVAFASVGVRLNGAAVGSATDLNFVCGTGTSSAITVDGSIYNINCSSALAVTGMANGGAVSMATSDTVVPLAYAYIRKAINLAAGGVAQTGTLANGIPGEVKTIYITSVGASGTWTLTPATATGFATIKFAAAKDIATFLYVNDTVGWIILSYTGTITISP